MREESACRPPAIANVMQDGRTRNRAKHMPDKQSLSKDDVEEVAGESVEISVEKTKLRKIAIGAKYEGKTLEWALQCCHTEEERQFVRLVWKGLA